MTDTGDTTEPTAAVDADLPAEPAADAGPAPDAPPTRSGGLHVQWWWLALGALGFLLLGSLLTFVGTKAGDDGPEFRRVDVQGEMRGGPGFPGGPGMQGGPGFHGGPGVAPGYGPDGGSGRPQFGPPEQGDRDQGDQSDGTDDGTDRGDEDGDGGSSDTTDTTGSSDTTS